MPSNYDNSAFFYDRLSRVVFGNALKEAQIYLLPNIPSNSRVLIIGGGTGWIIEEISKVYQSGLHIVYVEISAKMMARSVKRKAGTNQVNFVNKPVEELMSAEEFDVVITPFLLDNYSNENLPAIFNQIHSLVKPGGLWLYTDFQLTNKWWQPALLKTMLLFFKVLCGVESWRLPDVTSQFKQHNYTLLSQRAFYGKFIISKALRKPAR